MLNFMIRDCSRGRHRQEEPMQPSLNWKRLEHPTSSFMSQRGWNKQPRGLWSGAVQRCLVSAQGLLSRRMVQPVKIFRGQPQTQTRKDNTPEPLVSYSWLGL